MKKILSLMMLLLVALGLVACGEPEKTETPPVDLTKNVEVNVAINYAASNKVYTISYQQDNPYTGLNGKTYTKGMLLPVWEAIGEKANITFKDVADTSANGTNVQYTNMLAEGFKGVDLINGSGQNMGPDGQAGQFVDMTPHLDKMPNLKKFLDANPAVKQSIADAEGSIYFTPYFDGINELEHMYLARIDWIKDILDAANTLAFDETTITAEQLGLNYIKETPNTAKYSVTVANADATTRVVNKERNANIIDLLRAEVANGNTTTGKRLADVFRSYIASTYGTNHGYAKLSDIFAGTDASYDTDELIALMYVIKSNPNYILRETAGAVTSIELYFPREKSASRVRQMFRGLEMFGMRGVSSRNQWMYIDKDGEIYDVRGGKDTQTFIDGINNLNNLVKDGLIPNVSGFETNNIREELLTGKTKRFGFLTYDYNASQTPQGQIDQGRAKDASLEFQAILPPVNDWLGTGEYFHFSESNRSVKNEAWGIPSHVAANPEKLDRVLYLVDQMYNYTEADSIGNIHLYGPMEWRGEGTIIYGDGEVVYKLHETKVLGPEGEIATLANGTQINYLRYYLGATMPIGHIRSMGLEYQSLSEEGRIGIERINTAVKANVFRIAGKYQPAENDPNKAFYYLVPTFLPYDTVENGIISATTFRNVVTDNALLALMNNGFSGTNDVISAADYKALLDKENYTADLGYQWAIQNAYKRTLND